MKTKKLIFLSVMLMLLTATLAVAQIRSGCAANEDQYYIINGTLKSDSTGSDNVSVANVPQAALVQVGVRPDYLDHAIINWTIDIYKDNVFVNTITKGVGNYGTKWQPTIPASNFTAGAVVKVVMKVTPTSATPTPTVCTTPWIYTYNFTTATVCTPAVPTFFYQVNGSGGWHDTGVTLESSPITVDPMQVGITIEAGVHLNGGTVAWSDGLGFTSANGQIVYNPKFIAGNGIQTRSLTAAYTTCGTTTNFVYKLTSTDVCTPAAPPTYYYTTDGKDWHDTGVVLASSPIDIGQVPVTGSTIQVGLHKAGGTTVLWSDGAGGGVFANPTGSQTAYNPMFTNLAGGETRTLTATYTGNCPESTPTVFTYTIISVAGCLPSKAFFYYNTGDGNMHNNPPAPLSRGSITIDPIQVTGKVTIGVQLNGGSIVWKDDNLTTPFSGTSSEFIYNPGFTAGGQKRILTGTYTDTCPGSTPTDFVYNISSSLICIPNKPTFYFNDNSGSGWHDDGKIVLASSPYTIAPLFYSATYSPTVSVGVYMKGGSITWTDNNGMIAVPSTGTDKFQFVYKPEFTNIAGGETRTLTGAYTDTCGATTNFIYSLSSTAKCTSFAPIPYYNNGNGWKDSLTTDHDINLEVPIGGIIYFGIKSGGGGNGTNLWNDDITTTADRYFIDATGQEKALDGVFTVQGESLNVTGVYTDKCGASNTYIFHLKSPSLGVDKFEEGGFKMYPNPAESNLNIVFNGDLNASIINVSGQKLFSISISKHGSIDVSNLSKGIYFLKVVVNGGTVVKKFIKN